MRYGAMLMVVVALAMPGAALAQSSPITGAGSAQVHGQGWNMGQDLSSSPGPGAAPSRNEQMRQRASGPQARQQAARARGQAFQRQEAQRQQARRGVSSDAQHRARLAEARQAQARAEEQAARAFPGVR